MGHTYVYILASQRNGTLFGYRRCKALSAP